MFGFVFLEGLFSLQDFGLFLKIGPKKTDKLRLFESLSNWVIGPIELTI